MKVEQILNREITVSLTPIELTVITEALRDSAEKYKGWHYAKRPTELAIQLERVAEAYSQMDWDKQERIYKGQTKG